MVIQQKSAQDNRTHILQSLRQRSKQPANILLTVIEPLWLCAMVFAFWHHSPPIRDEWVGLLVGSLPIFGLRGWVHGRLWTPLAFHLVSMVFIALSIFNYEQAPYARNDYWVLIVRPLMGIWLVMYCVEITRQTRSIRPLLWVSLVGGMIIVWLGLTATQWTVKSEAFTGLLDLLPVIEYRTLLPDMLLSFNVNEMGGVLSWVVPLLLGVALLPPANNARSRWRLLQMGAGLIGGIALLALMLGQSRFAIGGVLGSLFLLSIWMLRGRKRLISASLVACLILLEIGLLIDLPTRFNPLMTSNTTTSATSAVPSADLLTDRDQSTLSQRLEIWQQSLAMIADYPLTGVGMSMFYLAVRYEPYIVSRLADRPPPHAHNEWLQIGVDLGVGGIVVFALWHGIVFFYLWRVIHHTRSAHVPQVLRQYHDMGIVLLCSLLPHLVFGMGDAIKLWDRYAFIGWWMMGLACAVYYLWQENSENEFHEYNGLW